MGESDPGEAYGGKSSKLPVFLSPHLPSQLGEVTCCDMLLLFPL